MDRGRPGRLRVVGSRIREREQLRDDVSQGARHVTGSLYGPAPRRLSKARAWRQVQVCGSKPSALIRRTQVKPCGARRARRASIHVGARYLQTYRRPAPLEQHPRPAHGRNATPAPSARLVKDVRVRSLAAQRRTRRDVPQALRTLHPAPRRHASGPAGRNRWGSPEPGLH